MVHGMVPMGACFCQSRRGHAQNNRQNGTNHE